MTSRRVGTPTVLSAASGVQTRELRRAFSGTATPTGERTTSAQAPAQVLEAAAADLGGHVNVPWWAPVGRWEKRRVVPHGALATNGIIATLGARPGVNPKPSAHPVEILKWVRSERPPATFEDEDEDDAMETEITTPIPVDEAPPAVDLTTDQNPAEASTPAEEPTPAADPISRIEIDGEETTPFDSEGTKRIVEEELEIVNNPNMTAMDVETILSHPDNPPIGNIITAGHATAPVEDSDRRSASPSPPSHAERVEAAAVTRPEQPLKRTIDDVEVGEGPESPKRIRVDQDTGAVGGVAREEESVELSRNDAQPEDGGEGRSADGEIMEGMGGDGETQPEGGVNHAQGDGTDQQESTPGPAAESVGATHVEEKIAEKAAGDDESAAHVESAKPGDIDSEARGLGEGIEGTPAEASPGSTPVSNVTPPE
ncbi:hypothetical protein HDV00_005957 [Rhizophlyctis rosea]|nr:hypothetical protein HDV00_005957 [Rhizophlyctis rosea]